MSLGLHQLDARSLKRGVLLLKPIASKRFLPRDGAYLSPQKVWIVWLHVWIKQYFSI